MMYQWPFKINIVSRRQALVHLLVDGWDDRFKAGHTDLSGMVQYIQTIVSKDSIMFQVSTRWKLHCFWTNGLIFKLFCKLTVISHQNSEHAFLQTAASSLPWSSVLVAAASASRSSGAAGAQVRRVQNCATGQRHLRECGWAMILFSSHFATLAHSFILSLTSNFLSTYYILSSNQDTGDTMVDKTDKIPAL